VSHQQLDPDSPEDVLRHFGGRPALALANSVLWRRSATPRELIHGYDDVVEHLSSVGSLTRDDDTALRASAATHPAEADAALARALDLRELLFRLLSAVAAGETPTAADLEAFNDAAGRALSRSTVESADGGFRRGWAADGADQLDVPAWEVARDARELLLDPEALERLKQCPGPECGWLFLDESRNRSRRWCDPRLCGNRERVKSHYRRRRASATP
jgi:predicted RNA-binding Zn ribbon-like protein